MMPARTVDVDFVAIIQGSGLGDINEFSPWDETRTALRAFGEAVSNLDELDRAQARQEAIAQLKLQKVDGATKLVDAAFSANTNARRQTFTTSTIDPDHWPAPVSTGELLTELIKIIRSYVVLSEQEAIAISLWIMAGYIFDPDKWPWEFIAILSIRSPEKRCGKSLLLDVLCALLSNAVLTGNISAAALFRLIDSRHPVVLIDEFDSVGDEMKEALRNVLNSAYQRGRPAYRCVGQGADMTVEEFNVFGPVAVAGIGDLPGTVADRAISVNLKRKAPNERIERFNREARTRLSIIQKKASRWAIDIKGRLLVLDESLPENSLPVSLSDRATDIWRPLVCIAKDGGDNCLRGAIKATALSIDPDSTAESARVNLLRAMRDLFEDGRIEQLTSASLVEKLTSDETSQWAEFSRGKPISARQVARLLAPLGIRPVNLWYPGNAVKKGYRKDDLAEAWSRYLVFEPDSSASPLDDNNSGEKKQNTSASEGDSLADQSATCSDPLADEKCQKQLNIDEPSGLAVEPFRKPDANWEVLP